MKKIIYSAAALIMGLAFTACSSDDDNNDSNQPSEKEQAMQAITNQYVEGVVFHILKGQIEYDFELSRLEPLFDRMDIPVFRLETDYQYQDVEQLRIRLEAFAEIAHAQLHALDRAGTGSEPGDHVAQFDVGRSGSTTSTTVASTMPVPLLANSSWASTASSSSSSATARTAPLLP